MRINQWAQRGRQRSFVSGLGGDHVAEAKQAWDRLPSKRFQALELGTEPRDGCRRGLSISRSVPGGSQRSLRHRYLLRRLRARLQAPDLLLEKLTPRAHRRKGRGRSGHRAARLVGGALGLLREARVGVHCRRGRLGHGLEGSLSHPHLVLELLAKRRSRRRLGPVLHLFPAQCFGHRLMALGALFRQLERVTGRRHVEA